MKIKTILLSDLHLENKNQEIIDYLLININEQIDTIKKNNELPVVLLAGDINNGIKGYDFIKNINARVIYVAGNHEFWGNDFYETNIQLKEQAPSNTNYLYNDLVIIEDTIFLGSTMWTDIGSGLNKDLFFKCQNVMNDDYYITAKQWFDNNEYNTGNDLKSFKKLINKEELINNKKWNIIIEKQENEKTIRFFIAFNAIYNLLAKQIPEEIKFLNYKKISETDKNNLIKSLNNFDCNLLQYLNNNSFIKNKFFNNSFDLDIFEDNEKKIQDILKNNEFLFSIFEKLKNQNLKDKKICVITHHLPFLEETLIGYHSKYLNYKHSSLPNIFNQEIDEKLFLINKGLDYPGHNYFYRCAKGDISEDKNLIRISHYFFNGSYFLPKSFIKNINLWVHGHNHYYNFSDYLKNIKIVNNPVGHFLDYKKEEIQNISKTQFKKDILKTFFLEEKDKEEIKSLIWNLYIWDREKTFNNLLLIKEINNKLLKEILKKIKNNKFNSLTLNTLSLSLNNLINEVEKDFNLLSKGYNIRNNSEYSFKNEFLQNINNRKNYDILINFLSLNTIDKELLSLNSFFDNQKINTYGIRETYFNSIYLSQIIKKIEDINVIFSNINIENPDEIDDTLISKFNSFYMKSKKINSFEFNERFNKKFNSFYKQFENKLNNIKNKP